MFSLLYWSLFPPPHHFSFVEGVEWTGNERMFLSGFLSELCYRWRSQVELFRYFAIFKIFFFNLWWVEWLDVQRPTIDPASVKEKKKKKKKFQTVDGNFFKKMEVFWRNTFLFSSRWTFNIVKRQRVCLKLNNCIFFFFCMKTAWTVDACRAQRYRFILGLGNSWVGHLCPIYFIPIFKRHYLAKMIFIYFFFSLLFLNVINTSRNKRQLYSKNYG